MTIRQALNKLPQTMRSRNEKEKAARRESLLNAAQTVFFDQGFERTSMDDIANEAGFSRGLLYVYFKDKKAIYEAIRIRAVYALRDRMLEYVKKAERGIDKVNAVGYAFYDFYKFDKNYFNCLSLNITLNNQSADAVTEAKQTNDALNAEKQTMQVMVDALQHGIEDGTIDADRTGNLLEAAMFLRGSLHGMILLQDRDGSPLLSVAGIDHEKLIHTGIQRATSTLEPL